MRKHVPRLLHGAFYVKEQRQPCYSQRRHEIERIGHYRRNITAHQKPFQHDDKATPYPRAEQEISYVHPKSVPDVAPRHRAHCGVPRYHAQACEAAYQSVLVPASETEQDYVAFFFYFSPPTFST